VKESESLAERNRHLKLQNDSKIFPTIVSINVTFSLPHDFSLTPHRVPLDTALWNQHALSTLLLFACTGAAPLLSTRWFCRPYRYRMWHSASRT
jgi:hypothetical protein